ncbi:MAG TPA: tRNA (N(6)-L-threonylcarbamoyladenosine(37)-C(2))-methylthiotransferase MtaB [Terriglobia bacterium]|nr:tRNA (N(6)-L-threonylcarbamoyladenosine(37)-C(2))-methylthiotransferase MtaB [Terriglobia bacterium]
MPPATFRILNFGCRASQADGAALKLQLLRAGLSETAEGQEDVSILNTCTVTAAADAEVRQIIRRIHRENPSRRILVTGCYAQRAPQEIAALGGVAWVVGNSHKHRVAEILTAHFGGGPASEPWFAPTAYNDSVRTVENVEPSRQVWVGEIGAEFHFLPASPDDRTRPTLKIQDGCNARCAFCVIPSIRGRSRSLPAEQAVAEVRRLEEQGFREVVLSGINLGSYGRDLGGGVTFLALLEKILSETRLPRLRISSIEPMDVTPELIARIAREPRMARHFHVPLQSGSDRVLRQMNRRYWTAHYADRIMAIRQAIPNCGIGADVMTGFPGETDEDHSISASFIESLPFTYLHIFPYSLRPSTPAASRDGQVARSVSRERAADLRQRIVRKRREFLLGQIGHVLSALTLSGSHEDDCRAISSNYLNIQLPGTRLSPNQIVDVRIQRVDGDRLVGHPEFVYRQAAT